MEIFVRMKKYIVLSVAVGIFIAPNVSQASYSLGHRSNFFIDSQYDVKGRSSAFGALRYVSDKSYFYIEDEHWNSLNSLQQAVLISDIKRIAQEFDARIYPRITDYYGSEWKPGIDNDPRITIFITPMVEDIGGYFNSKDEFLSIRVPDSNMREMFYVNAYKLGDSQTKGFLAHELHHMINFYQKEKLKGVVEDIWLNELRSEYTSTLLGYDDDFKGSNLESRVKSFLLNPSDSLTEWKNNQTDYGLVSVFGQYIIGRFGTDFLKKLISDSKTGISSINDVLASRGLDIKFSDIFTDWTIANFINSKFISDGRYSYKNQNLSYNILHVSPTRSFTGNTFKVSLVDNLKDWMAKWYEFKGFDSRINNTLKISFKGDPDGKFKVSYILIDKYNKKDIESLDLNQQIGSTQILNLGTYIKSVIIIPSSQKRKGSFRDNEPSRKFTLKVETFNMKSPIIESINPNINIYKNDFYVMINGANFEKGARVFFGSIESNSVEVIDSSLIIAVLPYNKLGKIDIKIINPNGESYTYINGFEYVEMPDYPDGSLLRANNDYKVYIIRGGYKRHILGPEIFNFYGHLGFDQVKIVDPEIIASYKDAYLVREVSSPKVWEVNEDLTRHWLNMTADQFTISGRDWNMIYIINKEELNYYKEGPQVLFR